MDALDPRPDDLIRRLEEELLDKEGTSLKAHPPPMARPEGGAREATREFFQHSTTFVHGKHLREVMNRLDEALRLHPSWVGSVRPKRYTTGVVMWCGTVRWSARRAVRTLFLELIDLFRHTA